MGRELGTLIGLGERMDRIEGKLDKIAHGTEVVGDNGVVQERGDGMTID